jgi:hypothetical protein
MAHGQVNSATIVGTVTDSSGAAVPNATVTATNEASGIQAARTTDDSGHYTIINLTPGIYDISATGSGLATIVRKKQELLVGVTVTLNFSLGVASVTQTVEVDTAPPVIDTTQANLSRVIETKEMDNLPTLSRGYTSLAALSPGVYAGAGSSTTAATISVGTSNQWSVGYVLDGASNARVMGAGNTANVAQDWIQEFSVVLQQAPAEYAFASSGYINAITRSGGNAIHGRVYGYFQDASLNATPGFLPAGVTSKPPYDQQRIGAMIGGPIKKDKLFYFLGYERLHNLTSATVSLQYPSITSSYAAAYPGSKVNLASGVYPQTTDTNLALVKMDYQINRTNSLHLTANLEHTLQTNNGISNTTPVGGGSSLNTQPENFSLVWDRVISPSMLNEARATSMGYFNNTGCNYANQVPAYNQSSAPNPSQASISGDPTGYWAAQVYTAAGGITFGCGGILWKPAGERQYTGFDHVSITRGNHTIKFGLDGGNRGRYLAGEHAQTDGTFTFQYGTNVFNPAVVATATPTTNSLAGSGCATAATCYPTQYKVNVDPNAEIRGTDQDPYVGLFVQDTWKVSPRLTLNLGMRWDEDLAYDFFGKMPAAIGQEPLLLPTNDPHDFGPRAGVAWTPFRHNTHSLIRGGFGVFYDANHSNYITNVLQADTAPLLGSNGLPLDIQITANSVSANPYCELGIATCTSSVPAAYQIYVDEVLAAALATNTLPNFNPTGGQVVVGPNTYTIPTFTQAVPPSLVNADPGFHDSGEYQFTAGYADQIGNFNFSADYVFADGFNQYHKRNGNIGQTGATLNPAYGVLQTLDYGGRLRDYSLQATAGYRDHRGDNLRLAYTLQYAYDNYPSSGAQSTFNAGMMSNGLYATDPYNDDVDYGPSSATPRNILNVSGVVPVYFGVLISPILSYNSGTRFNPTTSARSGSLLAPCPVYYAQCWPALGPNGTYLKDQFLPPSNYSMSLRISKKFAFGEKRSASVFFEAFNLSNHDNLTNFNMNYTSTGSGTPLSTFGTPTADGPSRKIQIGGQFDF